MASGASGPRVSKTGPKPRRASVSAAMVARAAGVSRSAVSRTFTDGASVSPATRAKVLAAAEALGYHVNHLARGLIHHRSGIVCLIVGEMQAPFQAMFVEMVTRRLQDAGKVVMVLNTSGLAANVEAALRQALNYRAEATVVVSGAPPRSLIETCIENGQRMILINRDDVIRGAQVIMVGNEAAARDACAVLARAGCHRLAVVSSTAGTPSITARESAFLAAAREAGLPVEALRCGPTSHAAGAAAARALLGRAQWPQGVFCVTDLLALGFLDAARVEFGAEIPARLSVMGFDDVAAAGWLGYGLTTYRQPLDEIAAHIAELVDAEDDPADDLPAVPRLFPAALVWRRTVAGPAPAGAGTPAGV